MKNYSFLLYVMTAILCSSCSYKYLQVYNISADDLKKEQGSFVYEDDLCRISYDFWGNGGNIAFSFENLTDENLYIVMPKSSYIINGEAFDYYSGREFSNRVTEGTDRTSGVSIAASALGFWTPSLMLGSRSNSLGITKSNSSSVSYTVSTKEQEYVCIPPKSWKILGGYSISDIIYKECDNSSFNYPNRNSEPITYSLEDTPIVFRNRIAVSDCNPAIGKLHFIDNQFYVSEVCNYKDREDVTFTSTQRDECGKITSETTRVSLISAPDRFYNEYGEYEGSNKRGLFE